MKFAFCLYNYFPFGGLQRDFFRIAKECLRRGHEVDVYTMQWEGDQDEALRLTLIPRKGLQNHTRAKHFVRQLQQHLKQKKYDAIVGFNKIPGLDIYYAADGCFQTKPRKIWSRLTPRYRQNLAYEKAVFNVDASTHILLIAERQQAEFMRCYHTPKERFHLLPPGIAKDRMAPDNALQIRQITRKNLQMQENEWCLLMVGSGFKTKGLDRILSGIAALPKPIKSRVKLLVVGQDNPEQFQKQALQLQIADKIQFLGGRYDIPHILLAADLLLHPAYHENTGTVLLEAIISGLPVLTTDVCGYAHYIQEAKAGMVLPSPFDQVAFNAALVEMITSLSNAPWQQNGVRFAKNADIYSMPERAVDIIESLGKSS